MVLAPAVSRGLAWGDYDDDGDVDLLVLRNRDRPQLLRNDQRSGNHWLIVATEDELGLGPVLNARISVEAAGRRRLREARGQQSYLATGDPRVHFGLGGADRIERLTIRWPDGRHEQWPGMAADRVVTIRQGTGTPVEAP